MTDERRLVQVVLPGAVAGLVDSLQAIMRDEPGAVVYIDPQEWRVVRLDTGAERITQEHGETGDQTRQGHCH